MLRRRPLSLPYERETALLAALLRGGGDPIEPPAPGRLVRAAAYHGVAFTALAAVREGRLSLPAADERALADMTSVALLRAAALRRELPALVAVLPDAVLVKGPALADRCYDDPRERPFSDLDLLVGRERLADAAAAVAALGWEAHEEFRPGFAERHGHDVHLTRREGAHVLGVDLHWRIGDDGAGDALGHARLAASAERLDAGGAAVAVPAGPEQLLVVALHLLSDRAKRLVWVRDVECVGAGLAAAEWERAFALADDFGLLWVLHRALDYAARHLGFERERKRPSAAPPAWGPLRAVESLDMRASTHVGRLAALPWRKRPGYLTAVLVPTRAGLRGTVGGDGAPTWRLAARHASRALAGLAPRRH